MTSRLYLLLVSAFFVTMNVLLWRSEITGRHQPGTVPVATVWHKIISAADISSLEIRFRGTRLGYCRWMPAVGEGFPPNAAPDQESPEGMIRQPTGYTLDLNGHLALDEATRLRFTCDLKLATNQSWQQFNLRVQLRPDQWELRALAADQSLTWSATEGGNHFERTFHLSDLQHPENILRELGGPWLPGTLAALGLPIRGGLGAAPGSTFQWQAWNDWLPVGHSRIRVYRLQMRLLERFQVVVWISPAGEILRAELPPEIVLVNDALSAL